MSYVLYIWEHPSAAPLPATIPEAARCVGLLRQSKPGPNSKFMALAKNLTARYPALNELPPSEDGEPPDADEYAWVDGELTGETDEAVFNLGLSTGMLDEVRPFVIEETLKLGLNIVDVQAGEVFLADGRTLAVTKKEVNPVPPPEEKRELPKTRELLRHVAERWAPLMKEHGYTHRKGSIRFTRRFDGGWQELYLETNGESWPIGCRFGVGISARLNAISDLNEQISGDEPSQIAERREEIGLATTVLAMQTRSMCPMEPQPFIDRWDAYYVTDCSQIEPMLAHIGEMLRTFWLPMLKKSETIDGVDDLLNRPYFDARHNCKVFYARDDGGCDVLAAYLVGNPRLEDICAEKERFAAANNWSDAIRCIEYVRQQNS